jgi:hypothetical protein
MKEMLRCPKSGDSVVRSRMPRIQVCSEQKIPATPSTTAGTCTDEDNSDDDYPTTSPEKHQNGDTGAPIHINAEEPIDVPAQQGEKETAELAQQSTKTRSGRSIKKPTDLDLRL